MALTNRYEIKIQFTIWLKVHKITLNVILRKISFGNAIRKYLTEGYSWFLTQTIPNPLMYQSLKICLASEKTKMTSKYLRKMYFAKTGFLLYVSEWKICLPIYKSTDFRNAHFAFCNSIPYFINFTGQMRWDTVSPLLFPWALCSLVFDQKPPNNSESLRQRTFVRWVVGGGLSYSVHTHTHTHYDENTITKRPKFLNI